VTAEVGMPYQLTNILNKCDAGDYDVLVTTIGTFHLVDDAKLREELAAFVAKPTVLQRTTLNHHIEKCLRYFGSADLAYFVRTVFGSGEPAGVPVEEIIDDVSKRLKVKLKPLGSIEAKLERLVKAVAEKTFFSLTPEQQRELFKKAGLSEEQQRDFFEKLKKNKALFLPALLSIVGPKVLQQIISSLVVSVLTQWLGREAAKQVLRRLATKVPWWTEWLGPIVWALSLGWLALDLQGPAYRKTVPILLYLGIVCLRDGPADGDAFWSESVP
jgi:uncharacterized protein YaaW (UPF0174 family)